MQGSEHETEKSEIPLMAGNTEDRKLCPFVETPREDCYISHLDSQKIEAAVYYCGENYKKCILYQELVKGGKTK